MYTSEAEAVAAIQELGNGWDVFPYDDPLQGVLGYSASRCYEPGTEPADEEGPETHIFQWPLFGQPLEPEVQLVPARALIGFAREEAEFLAVCDDPKARLVGFVSYRQAAAGKAVVRHARLVEIRTLPERQELLDTRNRVREIGQTGFSERLAAASALSTALTVPSLADDEG